MSEPSHPYQITLDERWTMEPPSSSGHGGWVQVQCFLFTYPDGTHGWADYLGPEDAELFNQQEAERKEAAAAQLDKILFGEAA